MIGYAKLIGLAVAGVAAVGSSVAATIVQRKAKKKEENKKKETSVDTSEKVKDGAARRKMDSRKLEASILYGKWATVKTSASDSQQKQQEHWVKADKYDPGSVSVEDDLV